MTSTATILLSICITLLTGNADCDKGYRVVDEFDAARVSNHYQISFLGMDIFSLRSKPVLSLLKEREDSGDQEDEITSDIFSLDWDKWWSERGEPVLEALKQNPHFVAVVCAIVAVVRALGRSVVQEQIDVRALADEIVAGLPPDSVDTKRRMEQLVAQMEQVTRNQDVIARAFARVICILRGNEPVADEDSE